MTPSTQAGRHGRQTKSLILNDTPIVLFHSCAFSLSSNIIVLRAQQNEYKNKTTKQKIKQKITLRQNFEEKSNFTRIFLRNTL